MNSLVWKWFCGLTTYNDCDIDIDYFDPIDRSFCEFNYNATAIEILALA